MPRVHLMSPRRYALSDNMNQKQNNPPKIWDSSFKRTHSLDEMNYILTPRLHSYHHLLEAKEYASRRKNKSSRASNHLYDISYTNSCTQSKTTICAKYYWKGKNSLQACDLFSPLTGVSWDRKNYDFFTPMQFGVTLKYHRTTIRRATIKNSDHNNP